MHIKNRPLCIILKLLIIVLGLAGELLHFGIFDGTFLPGAFLYFTVLSNIAVTLYTVAALIRIITHPEKAAFSPLFRGATLTSITLTMLVALIILPPRFTMALVLLHIVVPILFILDWLFFDTKGGFRVYFPILWMIAPLVYFITILILAGNSLVIYPYPFMDVAMLGFPRVILNASLISICFVTFGYLLVGLDRKLKQK